MPALLAALERQAIDGPLRVLVLANNCSDGTADVARKAARRIALRVEEVTLASERANAGTARSLAMNAGVEWLREDGYADAVLISTDADTVPPPHWIAASLRAIEAGCDAVGGEIRLPDAPVPDWLRLTRARVARYWSAVRRLAESIDPVPHDPWPRHGDHTGASLALTLSAYVAAGGVPPIPTGEDNALVAAVERCGGRVRHDPDVWTAVSVREDGRAAGGMATEMRRWRMIAETGASHLVPDAGHWQSVLGRRRALRVAYAADPGLAPDCVNDIAYVARIEPTLPALLVREQEIGAATATLESLVA
ncbi:glycosyltransferase [Roseomonas arctica]|uniref:Glycosyltransferase n=1 Tax=Plastoroseomonas arctica TaxID=1509237 RepID=A0AAF1K5A2_9PROT|nr:glycosyltransferase [Plastoroseomonas arctica]